MNRFLLLGAMFASQCSLQPVHADATDDAKAVLAESGVSSGFVVHLGAGDGGLTAALKQNDTTQVHGLENDKAKVATARANIRANGEYGNVSIVHFTGDQLPYVDNLVNLFVAENLGDVSMDEVLRVLVPNGIAMIGKPGSWKKTVKPYPDNIDEWSHYLHDASGNSVAHDDVVGPPRHLQWVGSPRWSRHHDRMASMSALVSTNGRMFYIMDEGSRVSIQLPPKWKLVARDAFNGSILWKRDIATWQNHLWPLKSGPTQLSRRLVSSKDTVFATMDIEAPLTALDAKTGKTLRTYEGSDATEEIIHKDGLLFLVVRKGKAELADYAPLNGRVGDQAKVRELFWNEEPRVLMAFEAETGKQLWARTTKIAPLTLSANNNSVCFHDGEKVVCVDQKTGDVTWNSEAVTRRKTFTFNFGPRMVTWKDVVLYAGGDGKMVSLDAASGKELWTSKHPNSGYQSPQDLMVLKGLVWCAPTTSGKDSGVFTGRDPRTGEVKKEFKPDVDTYWFHHRCYIAKATDNFLMPSRTGIEFVDPEKEHWDIHHWVRGGCLYGVMPCNGLTYAPPHNCACYPEAKLFGFNALAPYSETRPVPAIVSEEGRLEKGPAYLDGLDGESSGTDDWPTYRGDKERSGMTKQAIAAKVTNKWTADLGGRITSPVIADGRVYVAQIDNHTLHAFDEQTGEAKWTFTAGARIDSPPTVHLGRVVFGGADGWVYCVKASTGKLVWRYRAAPLDRRTMAYEQLESLWPVHGSVLIRDKTIYTVAGRSNFLDGGLRLLRLDLQTGNKISETIMDETNPATGNNLQEVLEVLQMPVGLPDILSSDDKYVYMKSQKFDLEGNRLEIGPNSGDFATQASRQRGEGAHLFAPMGYLDDTWFHRSYWVMGQSFAGGHGGYYQAGRFAPSGRLLVNGDGYVYGYGRKPEYLRWTTTLEHQLFAASPEAPEIPDGFLKKKGKGKPAGANSAVSFGKPPALDPKGKPITTEAWFTSTKPKGTIIARGGPTDGFGLTLEGGFPCFHVRSKGELVTVKGKKRVIGGWHHIAGVLAEDNKMTLYVDGENAGEAEANGLLANNPVQGLEIGADNQSAVGNYTSPNPFVGIIDEVRMYFTAANADQIAARFKDGSELNSDPVLVVGFDDGSARDMSTYRNNGTIEGAKSVEGKAGKALQFSAKAPKGGKKGGPKIEQPGNSLVKPKWTADIPIYVRAMVLAGQNLFVVGPPDTIDEESTFKQLTEKDPEVQKLLTEQDEALAGKNGGLLLAVNCDTGEVEHKVKLDELPSWDGLAGANGQLFLSTTDGKLMCFGN